MQARYQIFRPLRYTRSPSNMKRQNPQVCQPWVTFLVCFTGWPLHTVYHTVFLSGRLVETTARDNVLRQVRLERHRNPPRQRLGFGAAVRCHHTHRALEAKTGRTDHAILGNKHPRNTETVCILTMTPNTSSESNSAPEPEEIKERTRKKEAEYAVAKGTKFGA